MRSERAREQLRQERETFEQARAHDGRWFTLRLAMGYVGIGLMVVVAAIGTYVILHPDRYSPTVLAVAAGALLVDMISLAASIFRLVLQQNTAVQLRPITRCDVLRHE